jgi:hypothetical protein
LHRSDYAGEGENRMQQPVVQVFVGDEIQVQSERDFLAQVKADLESAGRSAVILANFFTRSGSRQVDFVLATDRHACHVELKSYDRVLRGSVNGPWTYLQPDGTAEVIDRQNPYHQALACKMALSDDMSALAARDASIPRPPGNRKYFTQLESVVCVFPALADGSDVPSDFKVKTLGYREFFSLLSAPGKNASWKLEHWQALIRDLGLVNAGQAQAGEGSQTAAIALISQYRQRFDAFHRRGLHELVPVPLTHGGKPVQPGDLPAIIRSARHVELTGRSGCGKSHLLRHILLGLDASVLPVIVEAGMYQGRLSALTDRSVARFTTVSTTELLRAAAICGQTVLLAVDGLNECPGRLRETLAGDLDAFCLQTRAQTIVTSQEPTEPSGPATSVVQVSDLGDADRRAVLTSYGADDILPFCDPFTTPYELSIAAACAGELHGPVTRAALFSSFVRRQLGGSVSPAAVRDTLRQLALAMDEQLATWLPLDEVWRISEEHLARLSAPVGVIDQVLASALVRTSQGKLSFTHELLGRFLVVEALRRDHPDPLSLAGQLRLPRHAGLSQLAVELETAPARISVLLPSLADRRIYAAALRGDSGRPAQRAARASAVRLLVAVTNGLEHTTFTVRSAYEAATSGGYELSEADGALLLGVGALAAEGWFTEEIAAVLDATDAACRRSADLQQRAEGKRPSKSEIVSAVLEPAFNEPRRPRSAASALLTAARLAWPPRRSPRLNAGQQVADQVISSLLDGITPRHHGRLLLLCHVLQAGDSRRGAGLVPRLLRVCWASGVYHVMLDSLAMTRSFASAAQGSAVHDEIVEVLGEIRSDNWALSTMLVEALYSYGLVESPYDEDFVRGQVGEVLSRPQDQDARELAYTIVSNQFEDVIAEPYVSVIDGLEPGRRIMLYTLASLGSPSCGFWNDWLLDRLIEAGDPQALPAFQRWATCLYTDTPSYQEAARCYALAVRGWAQFQPDPPPLANVDSGDAHAAWEHYAAVLFWLHRPGVSPAEAARRCEPHWQHLRGSLLHAAADPLYQLENANQLTSDEASPPAQIMRTFPDEVRPILEWSIQHPADLAAAFAPAWGDRTQTLIRLLARVGNAESAELLREYADDPELGPHAIAAVKYLVGKPG